ncbi:MAG: ABC transporter substrate-binding protein [Thermomicrobiales bacterium]
MRCRGTPLTLAVLLAISILPALSLAGHPAAARQSAAPAIDLVRLGWADVSVPTPFRISTAGPGGAVLLSLIFDTLTWKDEHGIIPWLATEWAVSADGLEYRFTLAPDVAWHDRQPLTAEDVAFSFDYYARHPFRWLPTAMVQSASVAATNQVVIRLAEPYAPFLEEIAGGVPIIPRHVWASVADPTTYDGPDAGVGSGPYQLAEYRSADGAYRLVANPDYFNGTVTVGEFQQLNTPAETRIQAVQQGELDLAFTPDASIAELFDDDSRVKVFETQPQSIVRLAVNTTRPPLDQPEVRQAIVYALDRAQIARVVTKGEPILSDGVVPPESPWFNSDLTTYPYDPAQARELLGGQTYTIELIADPSNREPELMEPMLKEVGITLVTKRVDGKTRTELLREGNFQLGLVQHIGVGGDPDFLRRWYAGEEANDFAQGSLFAHPEFERLGREQAATLDPTQRQDAIFAMQAILAEELPTIVLYHRRFYWVYDSEKLTPMATWGGLMNGIPLVYNKLIFLQR